LDPFITLTVLEEAEIIPGKDPDTRIKPLAFTNGHFRNGRVTAVSLLKKPFGGFSVDTSSLPPRWGSLRILPSPIAYGWVGLV
jgi:hypothetical protein